MSHSEDRNLDFVLKHYKSGAFDTQKAIERFNAARGISQKPRRRMSITAIVISAAAAILLGVFLFTGRKVATWKEIGPMYAQQTTVLPDGTSVTLASGSSLKYRFEEDIREVRMEGKVYFDVARDENRPFEVDADEAFVRVLGTEFMVDVTDASAARIYVNEGKVLFARDHKAEGVVLTEGMGACLLDGEQMPVADQQTDVNSIAWQRGSFVFDQTPLKEVLDCLSDYYHVSFAATDLSRKLSGEFYTDDLDMIIHLIESALDVTIIRK